MYYIIPREACFIMAEKTMRAAILVIVGQTKHSLSDVLAFLNICYSPLLIIEINHKLRHQKHFGRISGPHVAKNLYFGRLIWGVKSHKWEVVET